jgi:hypothetical protein
MIDHPASKTVIKKPNVYTIIHNDLNGCVQMLDSFVHRFFVKEPVHTDEKLINIIQKYYSQTGRIGLPCSLSYSYQSGPNDPWFAHWTINNSRSDIDPMSFIRRYLFMWVRVNVCIEILDRYFRETVDRKHTLYTYLVEIIASHINDMIRCEQGYTGPMNYDTHIEYRYSDHTRKYIEITQSIQKPKVYNVFYDTYANISEKIPTNMGDVHTLLNELGYQQNTLNVMLKTPGNYRLALSSLYATAYIYRMYRHTHEFHDYLQLWDIVQFMSYVVTLVNNDVFPTDINIRSNKLYLIYLPSQNYEPTHLIDVMSIPQFVESPELNKTNDPIRDVLSRCLPHHSKVKTISETIHHSLSDVRFRRWMINVFICSSMSLYETNRNDVELFCTHNYEGLFRMMRFQIHFVMRTENQKISIMKRISQNKQDIMCILREYLLYATHRYCKYVDDTRINDRWFSDRMGKHLTHDKFRCVVHRNARIKRRYIHIHGKLPGVGRDANKPKKPFDKEWYDFCKMNNWTDIKPFKKFTRFESDMQTYLRDMYKDEYIIHKLFHQPLPDFIERQLDTDVQKKIRKFLKNKCPRPCRDVEWIHFMRNTCGMSDYDWHHCMEIYKNYLHRDSASMIKNELSKITPYGLVLLMNFFNLMDQYNFIFFVPIDYDQAARQFLAIYDMNRRPIIGDRKFVSYFNCCNRFCNITNTKSIGSVDTSRQLLHGKGEICTRHNSDASNIFDKKHVYEYFDEYIPKYTRKFMYSIFFHRPWTFGHYVRVLFNRCGRDVDSNILFHDMFDYFREHTDNDNFSSIENIPGFIDAMSKVSTNNQLSSEYLSNPPILDISTKRKECEARVIKAIPSELKSFFNKQCKKLTDIQRTDKKDIRMRKQNIVGHMTVIKEGTSMKQYRICNGCGVMSISSGRNWYREQFLCDTCLPNHVKHEHQNIMIFNPFHPVWFRIEKQVKTKK